MSCDSIHERKHNHLSTETRAPHHCVCAPNYALMTHNEACSALHISSTFPPTHHVLQLLCRVTDPLLAPSIIFPSTQTKSSTQTTTRKLQFNQSINFTALLCPCIQPLKLTPVASAPKPPTAHTGQVCNTVSHASRQTNGGGVSTRAQCGARRSSNAHLSCC